MTDGIERAMQNLSLPQYSNIRTLFERVLTARSKQRHSGCAVLGMLAKSADILKLLDEDSAIYLREIGVPDARKKCESDLLGQVKRPEIEFNGAFGDFWSEIAAIRVLASKGYHHFRAIHTKQSDGKTSDYEAYLGDMPAYVEVKNMRANKTIVDVFHREIRQFHRSDPTGYAFNIRVDYPYDNPPTGAQERAIHKYVASLRGRKPPFRESLDAGDAAVRITVKEGSGTAMMMRGIGPETPEPLSKERFLAKIHDKAEEALAQMKDKQRVRVLVINFDSPSACIAKEFIYDAEEVVRTVFNGAVQVYVLHYRYLAVS